MTPEQVLKHATRAQLRAALELICPGVNFGGCSKGHMLEVIPTLVSGRPYLTTYREEALPIDRVNSMVSETVRWVRDDYGWGEDLTKKFGYRYRKG